MAQLSAEICGIRLKNKMRLVKFLIIFVSITIDYATASKDQNCALIDVALEFEQFLAPNGYVAGVQVSIRIQYLECIFNENFVKIFTTLIQARITYSGKYYDR